MARRALAEDHHRIVAAALRPPVDWRRPAGRPRITWLRTVDKDVQPQNFGVHTAWRKAKDVTSLYGNTLTEFANKNKKKKKGWKAELTLVLSLVLYSLLLVSV